ncbi:MAG: hypothetical protein JWO37_3518 [Acidimicrobiales bacterium]|jgi:uncharacterized membrane protein|nr:hypothetical protein [Acidimicrobiales bacterium]
MVLATVNSGLYKLLFVIHILAAIAGFGVLTLGGLFGLESKKRPGAEGLAVFDAYEHVALKVAERIVYTVPVWGILLVLASGKVWKFSQTWVWVSLLLYIGALGFVHAVHVPNLKRMRALMAELVAIGPPPAGAVPTGPPPQVTELGACGQRAGINGMILNLALVAIVVLMVWKPGI